MHRKAIKPHKAQMPHSYLPLPKNARRFLAEYMEITAYYSTFRVFAASRSVVSVSQKPLSSIASDFFPVHVERSISIISDVSQSKALQIFTNIAVFTFSPLPSFAMDVLLMPAIFCKSRFIKSLSSSFIHSFL